LAQDRRDPVQQPGILVNRHQVEADVGFLRLHRAEEARFGLRSVRRKFHVQVAWIVGTNGHAERMPAQDGRQRGEYLCAVAHGCLRTFSIALPFASSSTSLSRMRMRRISGSSTSSTRTPQTTPATHPLAGFMAGAWAKKVSMLQPCAICFCNPCCV